VKIPITLNFSEELIKDAISKAALAQHPDAEIHTVTLTVHVDEDRPGQRIESVTAQVSLKSDTA